MMQSVLTGVLLGVSPCTFASAPVRAAEFDVVRFVVIDNTLLPPAEVERVLAPYAGKHKNFRDVQRAMEALEQAYRAHGYGIVQVVMPEQDVSTGVVRFRVVQPTVSRVAVEGNRYFNADNIRRTMPAIREGETPNSAAIARALELAAEHPRKQTQVLFRGGASEGEVEIALKVADEKPWRATVRLENGATADEGAWRAGIGLEHTNLYDRDHSLMAQYITSPLDPGKINTYALGYRAPYYRLSSSLDLTLLHSDARSGIVPDLDTMTGKGTAFGARWNLHISKRGELAQKLTAGLDYRAFRSQLISTDSAQRLVPDVTVHPASLGYSGRLRMAAAELNFYGAVSANIPGGSAGRDSDFAAARAGAKADYILVRYGMSHVQGLPLGWQGRAAASAQYTRDALVPGEQFGLGGPDTVRGYLLRQLSDDRGYAAQFELYSPWLTDAAKPARARLLVFYDLGAARRNKAPAHESEGAFIASAGLGVRGSYGKCVTLRLDLAHILKSSGDRRSNDWHASGTLALTY